MKPFCFLFGVLLTVISSVAARELACGAVDVVAVDIDPETTIHLMADEVSAADFARLMPEAVIKSMKGPARSVTRKEAVEYASRLTELNRKLGLLKPDETLRLPSLKEWRAVATAPAAERESLRNLDSGVRELCRDTKTGTFPSREDAREMVEHRFVAVVGAHDKLKPEAIADAMKRPAWIRAETRSEVVGFRLVVDRVSD